MCCGLVGLRVLEFYGWVLFGVWIVVWFVCLWSRGFLFWVWCGGWCDVGADFVYYVLFCWCLLLIAWLCCLWLLFSCSWFAGIVFVIC